MFSAMSAPARSSTRGKAVPSPVKTYMGILAKCQSFLCGSSGVQGALY